jgi:hypothetical protein
MSVTLLLLAVGFVSAGSAQAATLPTLSLTISSSAIVVGGTPQSGGVNVVSSLTGGVKEAGALLVLLKPGVTPAELYAYLALPGKKDINAVSKYGAILFSAEAAPGPGSEVQTSLVPGQYVALATVGEGPPKFHTSFSVSAAKAPVALPTPQATIRAIDFGFTGPKVLHDGELVGFENEGWVAHMDIAFPAKSQKIAKQIASALRAGRDKKAEKLVAGPPVIFTGAVSNGAYQQETISAKPGWYVLACFMNSQDGSEHTRLGMVRVIKITK